MDEEVEQISPLMDDLTKLVHSVDKQKNVNKLVADFYTRKASIYDEVCHYRCHCSSLSSFISYVSTRKGRELHPP